jgi:hypothetical protein
MAHSVPTCASVGAIIRIVALQQFWISIALGRIERYFLHRSDTQRY